MGQRKQFAQSIYGAEPQTMDELGHAVIKVLNAYKSTRYTSQGMYIPELAKCVGLAWHLAHSSDLRHTHNSPEGHKTCWGGCKPKHEPYSGWYGRVWVRYEAENGGSEAFSATLTHPGTGGGGHYDGPWKAVTETQWNRFGSGRDALFPRPHVCSWDYTIFDLDWPELTEIKDFAKAELKWERTVLKKHNEQAMLAKFEGRWIMEPARLPQPVHDFRWEDAETRAKDDAFLLDCRRVIHQKEVLSLLR